MNGVDVANVTPSFSNEEWNKLGNNGCSYVQRERKILSRCHRGGATRLGHGCQGRGGSGGQSIGMMTRGGATRLGHGCQGRGGSGGQSIGMMTSNS